MGWEVKYLPHLRIPLGQIRGKSGQEREQQARPFAPSKRKRTLHVGIFRHFQQHGPLCRAGIDLPQGGGARKK